MKNDKQEKIELRQLLVEREYEYQNNLKNNSSSLYSNVKFSLRITLTNPTLLIVKSKFPSCLISSMLISFLIE